MFSSLPHHSNALLKLFEMLLKQGLYRSLPSIFVFSPSTYFVVDTAQMMAMGKVRWASILALSQTMPLM
jgi:hypothetical protein